MLVKKNNAIAETQKLKIELQQSYFTDQINNCQNDPKRLWRVIKEFWPTKPKSCTILKIENTLIDSEKSNVLNTHFATIGEKLASAIPEVENQSNSSLFDTSCDDNTFEISERTSEQLCIAIMEMKSSNSCGLDGLTAKLIKSVGYTIFLPLLYLYNTCISKGTFPATWKRACITQIFKEGDPSKNENYRPISILPCLGKLFEKLIHMQLYTYIENYDILLENQSGF